jgi:tetratricopeptide (TPR) repeat protein
MTEHQDEFDRNDEPLCRLLADAVGPEPLSDNEIEALLDETNQAAFSDEQVARLLEGAKTFPPHRVSNEPGHRLSRDLSDDNHRTEVTMHAISPTTSLDNRVHVGTWAAMAALGVALAAMVFMTPAAPPKGLSNTSVGGNRAADDQPEENQPDGNQPSAPAWLVAGPISKTSAPKPVRVGDTVRTAARQRQRVTLPDGSAMYVNENTEVVVESERRVQVASGTVFIEVVPLFDGQSHDGRFVVETPGRTITALGTRFAVAAESDRTNVIVTQGKVRVSGVDQEIEAGQELTIAGEQSRLRPSPRASQVLSWTQDLMTAAIGALVPASEFAGGALVTVDPKGQETRLSLRKFHIDVHIEDGFARTTIDQTYFNATWSQLEGTFYFPLPPDASLSRLAMYVNGTLMEGGMAERQHARNTFEQIRHTKRDPALLEWVDGSTFKMRVFPLEARREKRIVLSYTQRLGAAYGKTHYRFPAGHNLEVVRDWSTRIRVKNGGELDWKSPSHELKATLKDGDLVLEATRQHVAMDRDVVLELDDDWTPQPGEDAVRLAQTAHEDQRYVMLRYRPHLAGELKRPRRNWVFLFEASGDRDPLLARVQVEVVRTLLKNAEHNDTFAIVAAGTRAKTFKDDPVRCSAKNIAAAIAFLEKAHLVGALDFGNALDATKQFYKAKGETHLVHVGSAVPALGVKDEKTLAESIPAEVRYVGVGVGKRWSRQFMKMAVSRTGGYFTQINPDEKVGWRAFELGAILNAPRLLKVSVVDNAEKAEFLTFAESVAQGEEICAIARIEAGSKMPEKIVVAGQLNGKPWSRTLPVEDVVERADYLPRSWAKLEIDRLLADGAEKNKPTIIALSKAMYVMSPFTSLLVLENDAMYQQFSVDRGRKDHWALYACPQKIPVVYEPNFRFPVYGVAENQPAVTENVLDTIVFRHQPQLVHWPNTIQLVPYAQTATTFLWSTPDDGLRVWDGAKFASGIDDDETGVVDERDWMQWGGKPWGIRAPQYGMARTGTPIGLPGPPHIPFGAPAGFQRHIIGHQAQIMWTDGRERFMFPQSFRTTLTRDAGIDLSLEYGVHPNSGWAAFRNGGWAYRPYDPSADWLSFGAENSSFLGELELGRLSNRRRLLNMLNGRRRVPSGDVNLEARIAQYELAFRMTQQVTAFEVGPSLSVSRKSKDRIPVELHRWSLGNPASAAGQSDWSPIGLPSFEDYQRPQFGNDRGLFGDLVAHAPGLNTTNLDVLAAIEAKVAPDEQPDQGRIDTGARKLIDGAREFDWESVTIQAREGYPEFTVRYDGQGRFAWERSVSIGLREQVVCDGETLWHLYGDIGLGGQRSMSRFHRSAIESLVPWLVRPVDELARGADVRLVDKRTVAVIPHLPEDTASGERSSRQVDSDPQVAMHLIFGSGGRLIERRLIERPSNKTLARTTFNKLGRVRMFDADGKRIAEDDLQRSTAEAPDLKPETDGLVMLRLPYRTASEIFRQAKKPIGSTDFTAWNDDDAVALLAADCVGGNGYRAFELVKQRLFGKEDHRPGLYVLLASRFPAAMVGGRYGQPGSYDYRPQANGTPLQQFVRHYIEWCRKGDDGTEFVMPGPEDGFVQRLAAARNLFVRWKTGATTRDRTPAQIGVELERALNFVATCDSPEIAWAVLSVVQPQVTGAEFQPQIAEAGERFENSPQIGWFARHERIRALFASNEGDEARRLFTELLIKTLESGVVLDIDPSIRAAFRSTPDGVSRWDQLIEEAQSRLLDRDQLRTALLLSVQLGELGDEQSADKLFDAVLDGLPVAKRPDVALLAVEHLRRSDSLERADSLLSRALEIDTIGRAPQLWRYAANLADQSGRKRLALARLESAVDLEFSNRPDTINLEALRRDYGDLLSRYEQIVDSSITLEVDPPADLLVRVLKAADHWRTLDDDDTAVCHVAARIIKKLGDRDLAWDYLTTPLAINPKESSSWRTLAQKLSGEKQIDLADLAYERAFEFEKTNADILFEHAQLLQSNGRPEDARQLLKRIVGGSWQPRFQGTKSKAQQMLQ